MIKVAPTLLLIITMATNVLRYSESVLKLIGLRANVMYGSAVWFLGLSRGIGSCI